MARNQAERVEMKHVQQTAYGECLPACLAMIAGCSLADCLGTVRRIRDREGFLYVPMPDAWKWLAERWIGGLTVGFGEGQSGIEMPFTFEIRGDGVALVTVASETREGVMHAVVWCPDRKMILDPQHDEPQPLSRYTVIEWNPLVRLDDRNVTPPSDKAGAASPSDAAK